MSQFDLPIEELAKMAIQKPDDFGYWGDEEMFVTWGFSGHNQTAISPILDQANFRAACDQLMTKYPDDFRIESFRHWACSWVEQLVCRILAHKERGFVKDNITEAFIEAIELHKSKDDYPILDEQIFSEMEAEAIINCISDLPRYMLDMIDEDDPYWVTDVIECLENDLNVYICPDAELYPKDSEILMAVYIKELWNPDQIDLWEEFCVENNLEFPPKKKNPNQLTLFGDNDDK